MINKLLALIKIKELLASCAKKNILLKIKNYTYKNNIISVLICKK